MSFLPRRLFSRVVRERVSQEKKSKSTSGREQRRREAFGFDRLEDRTLLSAGPFENEPSAYAEASPWGGGVAANLSIASSGLDVAVEIPALGRRSGNAAGNAVRGEPGRYILSASDPTAPDPAAQFSFALDWNADGTPDETVVGTSGTVVEHVFAGTGTYVVGVTATALGGTSGGIAQASVKVVDWDLRPDQENPALNNLVWGGTDSSEAIAFLPGGFMTLYDSTGLYVIPTNDGGAIFLRPPPFVGTGNVTKVIAYAQGGDDLLLGDVLGIPVEFDGGAGNDILVGGHGADLLVGSDGNDMLFGATILPDEADVLQGGSGRDMLVGGLGADRFEGGTDDDLLIAGMFAFSSTPEAAFGIQAEWLSAGSYASRVAHLTGTPGGNNLQHFLVRGQTIADDLVPEEFSEIEGSDFALTNRAPEVVSDNVFVIRRGVGTAEVLLSAVDPDGDTVTFAAALAADMDPAAGSVAVVDNRLMLTIAPDFIGDLGIDIVASDGITSTSMLLTARVMPVITAPRTGQSFEVDFSSPDAPAATYAARVYREDGTVVPAAAVFTGAVLTVTVDPAFAGEFQVEITVNSIPAGAEVGQIYLLVDCPNAAPTLALPASVRLTVGETSAMWLLGADDADGDEVSFTAEVLPNGEPTMGTVAVANGELVISPTPGLVGSFQILVTASDGRATVTHVIDVTVAPRNDEVVDPNIPPLVDLPSELPTIVPFSLTELDIAAYFQGSKYLAYRQRFLDNFFYVGQVAEQITLDESRENVTVTFADQTIDMGWALMNFAMESKLLSDAGYEGDTSSLGAENILRLMLRTFEYELDQVGELALFDNAEDREVPGFFIRDFIRADNQADYHLSIDRVDNLEGVTDEWTLLVGSDNVETNGQAKDPMDAACGVDQIAYMFMGWWAVEKWSNSASNRAMAREQAARVMDWLIESGYELRAPNGERIPDGRGGGAQGAAGFFTRMATEITGHNYWLEPANQIQFTLTLRDIYNALPTVGDFGPLARRLLRSIGLDQGISLRVPVAATHAFAVSTINYVGLEDPGLITDFRVELTDYLPEWIKETSVSYPEFRETVWWTTNPFTGGRWSTKGVEVIWHTSSIGEILESLEKDVDISSYARHALLTMAAFEPLIVDEAFENLANVSNDPFGVLLRSHVQDQRLPSAYLRWLNDIMELAPADGIRGDGSIAWSRDNFWERALDEPSNGGQYFNGLDYMSTEMLTTSALTDLEHRTGPELAALLPRLNAGARFHLLSRLVALYPDKFGYVVDQLSQEECRELVGELRMPELERLVAEVAIEPLVTILINVDRPTLVNAVEAMPGNRLGYVLDHLDLATLRNALIYVDAATLHASVREASSSTLLAILPSLDGATRQNVLEILAADYPAKFGDVIEEVTGEEIAELVGALTMDELTTLVTDMELDSLVRVLTYIDRPTLVNAVEALPGYRLGYVLDHLDLATLRNALIYVDAGTLHASVREASSSTLLAILPSLDAGTRRNVLENLAADYPAKFGDVMVEVTAQEIEEVVGALPMDELTTLVAEMGLDPLVTVLKYVDRPTLVNAVEALPGDRLGYVLDHLDLATLRNALIYVDGATLHACVREASSATFVGVLSSLDAATRLNVLEIMVDEYLGKFGDVVAVLTPGDVQSVVGALSLSELTTFVANLALAPLVTVLTYVDRPTLVNAIQVLSSNRLGYVLDHLDLATLRNALTYVNSATLNACVREASSSTLQAALPTLDGATRQNVLQILVASYPAKFGDVISVVTTTEIRNLVGALSSGQLAYLTAQMAPAPLATVFIWIDGPTLTAAVRESSVGTLRAVVPLLDSPTRRNVMERLESDGPKAAGVLPVLGDADLEWFMEQLDHPGLQRIVPYIDSTTLNRIQQVVDSATWNNIMRYR